MGAVHVVEAQSSIRVHATRAVRIGARRTQPPEHCCTGSVVIGDAIRLSAAQIGESAALSNQSGSSCRLLSGKKETVPHKIHDSLINSAAINGTSRGRDGDIDEATPNGRIEHQGILDIAEHVHVRPIVTVVIGAIVAPGPLAGRKGILPKKSDLTLAVMVITENEELFGDPVFVELDERPCAQGVEFFAHVDLPPYNFVVARRYDPLDCVSLRSGLSYLRA